MNQVRIVAKIEVAYMVEVSGEAYPGCNEASDVGEYEFDLIDEHGDYLLSMMSMDSATTEVTEVVATEVQA